MEQQPQEWGQWYQQAWQWRHRFIERELAAGERNPLRLINRLRAFERFHLVGSVVEQPGDEPRMVCSPREPVAGPCLPTGVAREDTRFTLGSTVVLPAYSRSDLVEFLVDFAQRQGPFEAVIELGCGFGDKLIRAHYQGLAPEVALLGGDVADSGLALARRLTALEPDLRVEFFPFDFRTPALERFQGRFQRVLLVTCFSLMFLGRTERALFEVLSHCAPRVTGLHLEPFGFQIEIEPDRITRFDLLQRQLFEQKRWNLDFIPALSQAERLGLLQIERLDKNYFLGEDFLLPASLALWHSRT